MEGQKQDTGSYNGSLDLRDQSSEGRNGFPADSVPAEVVLPDPDGMKANVPGSFSKINNSMELIKRTLTVAQRQPHCRFQPEFDHAVTLRLVGSRVAG